MIAMMKSASERSLSLIKDYFDMSKFYQYYITENLRELLSKPLRDKDDVLKVLFEISSYLLIEDKPINKGFGEFIIKVDKMSRVFITLLEEGQLLKHYSFNFPFIIQQEDLPSLESIRLISSKNRIEIDTVLLSVLKSASASGWFSTDGEMSFNCLLGHYEVLEEILKELEGTNDKYIDNVWLVMKELMLSEPGYLRYDYDQEHQNGRLHPLHHLDVNYTNHITFKLGLSSAFEQNTFMDLLDLRTNCHYVSH
ncbi:hypothetical protein [Paenibacillus sp. FSL P4-0081]|uniref:hypothetical protein n=1 Tax=Paenibacillus sp. FSL P4-0081 TaxID=1536769 RepID=UPI0012E0AD7C|nr:hypothetical protein [Paenibacillus sp. FSL P4-0081]